MSASSSCRHRCTVHSSRRTAEETFLSLGASIGYWRGDIKGLVDDIAALRPTLFIGVPRVFDRIYTGVMAKVGSGLSPGQ